MDEWKSKQDKYLLKDTRPAGRVPFLEIFGTCFVTQSQVSATTGKGFFEKQKNNLGEEANASKFLVISIFSFSHDIFNLYYSQKSSFELYLSSANTFSLLQPKIVTYEKM